MSEPERDAVFVGLHLGKPVELNEGRMLICEPGVTRLSLHPGAAAIAPVELRGTVRVAEALGVLDVHPRIYVDNPSGKGARIPIPFPYLGDLLWLFEDAAGPYFLNWTVKDREEDFEQIKFRGHPSADPNEDAAKARARHAIEETYYCDASIRTVRVTREKIPRDVANNLRQICLWHHRPLRIGRRRRQEIVELLRAHMRMQVPAFETLKSCVTKFHCTLYEATCVLYQSIWTRELRVDLFRPIVIDKPLRPEERDPMATFGQWFRRSE